MGKKKPTHKNSRDPSIRERNCLKRQEKRIKKYKRLHPDGEWKIIETKGRYKSGYDVICIKKPSKQNSKGN